MPNRILKILHLEDMPTDAGLVERELKRGNMAFDKIVVDNKQDFIHALETFRPDIILSDHALPSFNSVEALRIIREMNIRVPFILITATISEEFAVEVMKEGAYDYILKDRMQRLPQAIMNAMEKFRITNERQKFMDEVIANEALLKEAEHLAHFGSWEMDLEAGINKWSDEAYRLLGYVPGEVEPTLENFLASVHPDDRAAVQKMTDQVEHGSSLSLKMYFRLKPQHGEVRYIRSELFIKRNERQEPVRITGFNQDVTEARMAEEKVQRSEANLRTIFDHADTGYILFDTSLRIASFNQLAQKFSTEDLSRPLEEGAYCLDYFRADRRELLKSIIEDALRNKLTNYEINYPQSDGTDRWYYVRFLPVSNADHKNFGVIMALTDVTERKMSELQREKITNDLIQRNKDLEQFAYIISHNLRAPVANIIGFTAILNDLALSEGEKSEIILALSTSVRKLDEVIMDLNHILQVKREINENREPVRFSELVRDIRTSIVNTLERERVQIITDFSEADELFTLKSYLHSIFYNLITNSIKYRQPHLAPIIHITSHRDKNKLQLIFKDNGMGIDLEKRGEQVFGLYKRFHTQVEGKGMGLFMTKTQVETLGGHISIRSEVDKGTEFTIEFEV